MKIKEGIEHIKSTLGTNCYRTVVALLEEPGQRTPKFKGKKKKKTNSERYALKHIKLIKLG